MIYLASPYSHRDAVTREYRFREVCEVAARLMRSGHNVFSPIAHTHPIAQFGLPKEWDFWEKYDREFLAVCDAVWVLQINGWKESVGVQAEIKIARELKKPVYFLRHGEIVPRDTE